MERLTSVEKQALNAVDRDGIIAMLQDLVAIPSVSGSDAECDIQHVLAKRLRQLDLDVDLWSMDLEALQAEPGFPGTEAPRTEAWGLVGTHPGDTPRPALVVQGHVDVVPPGDRAKWTQDPFRPRLTADRVHGRGTCDMKAGVVANLAALHAIERSGASLHHGLAIHCVVGEEDGGLGAFGTLRRGHAGERCIITEPTGGTLVTGNAGALTFRIEVPGAATHGSTRYAGSSAIDSYLAIHGALNRLEAERNRVVEPLMREYPIPYPISVGRIRAGDWPSSVPDLLVAEGRMGLRIDEDPVGAREQLREVVHEVSARDPFLRDHPPVLTWSGGQFRGGQLAPGDSLRHLVGQAHADATAQPPPRERGAPYGSDLRLYAASGIPTLHYGPGDVRLAHGPNESVGIEEIVQVTQTLLLTILRVCG